jgi:hypothetical protein
MQFFDTEILFHQWGEFCHADIKYQPGMKVQSYQTICIRDAAQEVVFRRPAAGKRVQDCTNIMQSWHGL